MTQEELKALFEQGEISDVQPEDQDEQSRLAALFEQGEIEDVDTISTRADQAVRDTTADMGMLDKALVGAGRGLTDVGQAGRQLFEEYVDDPLSKFTGKGLTEPTAEEYQAQVASEVDTYEKGLGDSTAANVGRFVGQTAPTLAVPVGGLAAQGAGRAAQLANLLKMSAGGAAAGGAVGGSQAVGQTGEEILGAAGSGAAAGAIAAPTLGLAAPVATKVAGKLGSAAAGQHEMYVLRDLIRKAGGTADDVERVVAKMADDTDPVAQMAMKDAVMEAVAKKDPSILKTIGEIRGAATGGGPRSLLQATPDEMAAGLASMAMGDVTGLSGLVGWRTAKEGYARAGQLKNAAGYVGARAGESTAEFVGNILKTKPGAFGNFEAPLQAAASRGASSLAATMHTLSQTDPTFRAKLEQLEKGDQE